MAKDKICGIYKITSPSGAVYIGQSTNVRKRETAYKISDCKKQVLVYNSIQKYGWDAHLFEIIETLSKDITLLNQREKFWIDYYKCNRRRYRDGKGMNCTDGGDGKLGYIWAEQQKERVRGVPKHNEASRLKIKLARQANPPTLTEESREKMRQTHIGNTYTKGMKHTEETKRKMSASGMFGTDNSNAVAVLDLGTGIYYDTIVEAANARGYVYKKFVNAILRGYKWTNILKL